MSKIYKDFIDFDDNYEGQTTSFASMYAEKAWNACEAKNKAEIDSLKKKIEELEKELKKERLIREHLDAVCDGEHSQVSCIVKDELRKAKEKIANLAQLI